MSPRARLRLLFAAALAAGSCREPVEARLAREFDGAYASAPAAEGPVRSFDLTAAEAEVAVAGTARLRVWAYNGQVPGPTLRIRLGETLRVRFTNRLPEETTIHWHGVRVPNGMDGVPNLTQHPIAPNESFTYQFTPREAGTFWFHPHVRASEQVERGLYGLLVVEDREPSPYTREEAWVLDDWLLGADGQLVTRFNTLHDLAHDGRWGNVVTVNGSPAAVLRLRPSDRVRLRILNASNGRVYAPDFSGLSAAIIAVDGTYLREPVPLGRFELAPGNRLDLDLRLASSPAGPIEIADRFYPARPNPLAQVVAEPGAGQPPEFPSPARAKVPSWREGLSAKVLQEFRLNARQGGRYGIEWTINGEAFSGHDHAKVALRLRQGAFARLRFVNESYRLHPIHLHGMFFKVLARDGAPVDEPFFRDTVLVHGKETVDVGVVPLDEGAWMMHCHVLEHAEAGMMTLLGVFPG